MKLTAVSIPKSSHEVANVHETLLIQTPGLLITVTQFLLVSLVTLPSQIEHRRNRTPTVLSSPKASDFSGSGPLSPGLPPESPPRTRRWSFKSPQIPMRRLAALSLMFFTVNMMNNWAFAFDISVPMHIILRSFGSVTTLTVGWLCGKRYSRVQVGSVAALTLGVVVSAWADAVSKVGCPRYILDCHSVSEACKSGQLCSRLCCCHREMPDC